jgi:predicted ATPase
MQLTRLELENFKCFEHTDIDFAPITLLTGANSSGKTAIIHAILGALQSGEFPYVFSPNGDYVNMGNYKRMVKDGDVTKNIKVNLEINAEKFDIILTFEKETGMPKKSSVQIRNAELQPQNTLNSLAYLSSHRLPPQDYYYETTKSNLKVKADGSGFADQILQWQTQRDPRYKELVKIVKELTLAKDLKAKRNSNGTYELQIKPNNGGSPLSNLTDVGFGISQLLPIIVADLQLGTESLLIISQPETHLHPSIQAAFADYLTRQIRATKKRYIVETHSEYIINRLRLAIAKNEIVETELATYFLQNNGQKTETSRLGFHKNGQITNAPRGFFETYMLDVMNIALAAIE